MIADEQLALDLQKGQPAALEVLIERYAQPIVGYLYTLTGGDRFLAEDLMQESFLRVLRQINQYQHPRPFKPWLYAIATHLARNHYHCADARHTENAELAEDVPGANEPVEKTIERQEAVSTVVRQLQDLPAQQREVILLRYVNDFSLNEIAESLAIPLGTVKSRLSLGIRALQARVQFAGKAET
jgi:RNA polymerase sigma-70 factor, ECF subfamily